MRIKLLILSIIVSAGFTFADDAVLFGNVLETDWILTPKGVTNAILTTALTVESDPVAYPVATNALALAEGALQPPATNGLLRVEEDTLATVTARGGTTPNAVTIGYRGDGDVGVSSFANGENVAASGYYSHAEGEGTTASGYYSHAEGSGTRAIGIASHAEGLGTTASGHYSHAEGGGTTASGDYSHAEGVGTRAIGIASHAEGVDTTASGIASHAEGEGTTASGYYSHAEGDSTTAVGNYSHAEGFGTTASGHYSHAEGVDTKASGHYSHAEGGGTTASGHYSHAEGGGTTASGDYSHAEGMGSIASGSVSHASGYNAVASNITAFAWQGADVGYSESPYGSHGPGTFNINPVGGLAGLWIGEENMATTLSGYATTGAVAGKADAETVVSGAVGTASAGNRYFWTSATNVVLSVNLASGQVVNLAKLNNTGTNSITAIGAVGWEWTGGEMTNTIPAGKSMTFGFLVDAATGVTNAYATGVSK